jgi:N-acetylmuramoyl-L-alanine amidase
MSKPIAVSAGHYLEAKGAYNKTYNLYEHDLCWEFALSVLTYLEEADIPTVLVPRGTLTKKIAYINKNSCLCAVEIHLNSVSFNATGAECLYYPRSELGKNLATYCQTAIVNSLHIRDRGIVARDRLVFLSRTNCPAIITESLFLSNDDEVEQYLMHQDGRDMIVDAHVMALKQYYKWRNG